MRVISGKYKGRKLKGFDIDGTRPTMDRVKESLFGMLQDKINGSVCLDLFAGSGALGIEALSNGAYSCDFIDNNKISIKTIRENTKKISENFEIINSDYKSFLKSVSKKYDIIFLDPPYDANIVGKVLRYIDEYNLLNEGGIVAVEYENENFETCLKLVKEKSYGSKKIKIFEK